MNTIDLLRECITLQNEIDEKRLALLNALEMLSSDERK